LRYLLDTSVAIALRDGDPAILARSERLEPVPLVSIVTMVELEGGVARAEIGRDQRRAALDAMYESLDILTFGLDEASAYGRIVSVLGFSRGKVIDRMIAAQAVIADATLATLNARDFRGIPDLRVDDWSI